jgi:hypothetical protein
MKSEMNSPGKLSKCDGNNGEQDPLVCFLMIDYLMDENLSYSLMDFFFICLDEHAYAFTRSSKLFWTPK